MSFLAVDSNNLMDMSKPFYEVSFLEGIRRLLNPFKYHLHRTMGRPIIMLWKAN